MPSNAAFVSLGMREAMNDFRSIGVPAAGNGSGASRKALWVIKELGLPAIVKACVSCRFTRHHATGKFRVNANGKVIDVWMLIRCEQCGRTAKIPVHERVYVRALERERLLMLEGNDRSMVRDLAMDRSLAAQTAYRFDWTGTWKLETGMPSERGREDPGPLEVILRFELPVPIRVEKLLMTGFGLSRSVVRDMVASGRIRLPMAIDAKAREDIAFFVNATAPPPRDAAAADRRALRRRGALCVYTRRAR
jgi:hypothetical protein